VLSLGEAVAEEARASTLSDLGVACALAWAALESAALTARVNLAELADPGIARGWQGELDELLAEGRRARQHVSDVLARRLVRPDRPSPS
jgi:formiminotetrahydrofolate cyclodeaminase